MNLDLDEQKRDSAWNFSDSLPGIMFCAHDRSSFVFEEALDDFVAQQDIPRYHADTKMQIACDNRDSVDGATSTSLTCAIDFTGIAAKNGTAQRSSTGNHFGGLKVGNTIAHSVRRKVTNKTYLRRLHFSVADAVSLFPAVGNSVRLVHTMTRGKRSSSKVFKFRLTHEVSLHDASEREWRATFECVSTGGQVHCRVAHGWSQFCQANNIHVGSGIRVQRLENGENGRRVVVTNDSC
jgi:hypothetical protein